MTCRHVWRPCKVKVPRFTALSCVPEFFTSTGSIEKSGMDVRHRIHVCIVRELLVVRKQGLYFAGPEGWETVTLAQRSHVIVGALGDDIADVINLQLPEVPALIKIFDHRGD